MKQQILLEKIASFQRLATDVSFRNAFMANPKTIIQQEFPEAELAEQVRVHLHENSSEEMHIILLPTEQVVFNDPLDEKVEQVLDKAVVDTSFKKLLLADPKGTISKELPQFFVPDNFKIYFHENTDQEIHLIVPTLQAQSDELSEEELDHVAGGSGKGPHIGRARGGKAPRCRAQSFRAR